MKRKSSAVTDANGLRTNQELAVSTNKLADQLRVAQERIDGLESEKQALQDKLDDIDDIVSCDDPECDAQEHLSDIEDVLRGNGAENADDDDD